MSVFIAFGVVLLLLGAFVGKPYPQSWHERWRGYDR